MAQHLELIPTAPDGGNRLDVYLARHLGAPSESCPEPLSRARLQALIADGAVHIDGQPGRASGRVRPGQIIRLTLPDPAPPGLVPHPMALTILYEDAHLLVLDKPAHLVVHPGAGTTRPTLVHGLLAHCQDLSGIGGVLRPGIVHRLDGGTTGLMVVAKNDRSHRHLAEQFAARTVQKGYLALVYAGAPLQAGTGDIRTPYGRHPKDRRRMTGRLEEGPGTRRAHTAWRLKGQQDGLALLAVTLHTGRTHQIRAHLSELGCPIVGDPLYGPAHRPLPPGCANLSHQALHAAFLSFDHPVTHERLRYRAQVPASWRQLAETLFASRRSPCLD